MVTLIATYQAIKPEGDRRVEGASFLKVRHRVGRNMSNSTLMWEPSKESTPMDRFREQVNQKYGLNFSECVHVFLRYSLRCLTNRIVCCK